MIRRPASSPAGLLAVLDTDVCLATLRDGFIGTPTAGRMSRAARP
ncbi:MAG: hypothetical protein ACRDSG_10845 [Pseudonocardiaceae bacterium]